MKTYISILHGINVSGQKLIKMKSLQEMYVGLDFRNVRTYIQSGNVLFESNVPEHSLTETFGHDEYLPDEFYISGRSIYLFCPNGYGNTKLSNTFFEKGLKVRATTRNWKTLLELVKLSE